MVFCESSQYAHLTARVALTTILLVHAFGQCNLASRSQVPVTRFTFPVTAIAASLVQNASDT